VIDTPAILAFSSAIASASGSTSLPTIGGPAGRTWARAASRSSAARLAAAILQLSGWDRQGPFVDPLCGSGTIAIEAALWARSIAPGLARDRFGFERWACHDEAAARRVAELREQVRAKIVAGGPPIRGSDVDLDALTTARENARAAGVSVEWRRASVRDLAPVGSPGVIVTNPPYGERLPAPDALYQDMARAFDRMRGWRVAILAGAPAIERAMRAVRGRADRALTVFNGDIECRLLVYEGA
jgi:23S rRNA G2445 N2-methylase RlmL